MQFAGLFEALSAKSHVAIPRPAAIISCGVGALMSTGLIKWLPAEPA
jgi:hypothetical protein